MDFLAPQMRRTVTAVAHSCSVITLFWKSPHRSPDGPPQRRTKKELRFGLLRKDRHSGTQRWPWCRHLPWHLQSLTDPLELFVYQWQHQTCGKLFRTMQSQNSCEPQQWLFSSSQGPGNPVWDWSFWFCSTVYTQFTVTTRRCETTGRACSFTKSSGNGGVVHL